MIKTAKVNPVKMESGFILSFIDFRLLKHPYFIINNFEVETVFGVFSIIKYNPFGSFERSTLISGFIKSLSITSLPKGSVIVMKDLTLT